MGGGVLPWKSPPGGVLLDMSTKIRVSSELPRQSPLRGHQSAPPTDIRVIYCSYQPERWVPNTPCTVRYLGREKITTHDDDSDDDDRGVVDGGASAGRGTASTLTGPRVPANDLSWRYLHPPFSLG